MKRLILFLFLFALLTIPQTSNSQVKNVLLEQFTGTWCGWCVDGSYVMEQIQEKHPDRVLGVKIHNGDSMAIAEEAILRPPLGVTGFPMGTIDRRSYSGSIGQSRGAWEGACESFLQIPPKATVQVAYAIHEDIRQVHGTVYCTMLQTVSEQVRLNFYILEDSCSGVGTGWDQSNYLSNRAGYENNPYYNQPAKIIGYQHMKVLRAMCGGPWGAGDIPMPAVQGETYTYDFVYDLSDEWKIKDLHFIGLAQVEGTSNKEILNCAMGVEGTPELRLTTSGDMYDVVAQGVAFNKDLTLSNITDETKTYTIKLMKATRTPSDWECSAEADGNTITVVDNDNPTMEVTLDAGSNLEVMLTIIPGSTIGVGDAEIEISSNDNPDQFRGKSKISCYSAEIENFEIVSGGEAKYSILNYLDNAGYENLFQMPSTDYLKFTNKFMNKKHLVWNSGAAYQFSSDEANEIISSINSGIKTFICGNLSASALNARNSLGIFNVQYNGFSRQGYGSAPWRVWLSGVNSDPISNQFGNQTEGNLIQYLITMLKVTDKDKTKPFMHMANAGEVFRPSGNSVDTLNLEPAEEIFAVRTIHENTRSVLLALNPFVIVNQEIRQNLISRIMQWLDNTGPELDLNCIELNFGRVVPEDDKMIPVSMHNAGDETLTISDISIGGMDSYAFTFENMEELPITLEPGEYSSFYVKFYPTIENTFKAELSISSNAVMNPEAKLNIVGDGMLTGVYHLGVQNTLFSVLPNPASDRAEITLKMNGLPLDSKINFEIFSSMGHKIADLNNSVNNLTNTYSLDLSNYSSGTYMIVASFNGKKFAEPLVIIK